MIDLPTVDLLAMDGVDGRRAIHAVKHSIRGLKFRRVIFMAPSLPEELKEVVDEFHVFVSDYEGWNRFMVKDLVNYLPDGHVIFIHNDGYILNPKAWRPAFLNYDYIGAPWWYHTGINVGNGGFCLRSRKFVETSARFSFPVYAPEDHILIRLNGAVMEQQGIKFAPEILASKFALEGNMKWGTTWNGQFGFHNDKITDISRSKHYE